MRAARVLAVLLIAALQLVPAAAGAQDRTPRCIETSTAVPDDEVTIETGPGGVCRGVTVPGGGVLDADDAGGAPTRIDAGMGGVAASSSSGVGWLVTGAAAALWALRRRR